MKQFIRLNQQGDIIASITTNDETLDTTEFLDVSNHSQKSEIILNSSLFKVRKNKDGTFDKNGIEKIHNTK